MSENLEQYLQNVKYDKQYKKLVKKLKNKTVVIYGAGLLFQLVQKKYDLSKLNIIGISDGKFSDTEEGQEYLGYKIIPKSKLASYKPDYVLVATLKFINIIDDFRNNLLKGTKTKLYPLVDKPFLTLLKEIFEA